MAAEDHPDGQPSESSPTRMIDGYRDRLSLLKPVQATETFAEILEEAIESTDVGVTIVSDGNLHYNPVGAATSANGKLPTVYTMQGGKTRLDLAEFYSASAQDVSFIVFRVATGVDG